MAESTSHLALPPPPSPPAHLTEHGELPALEPRGSVFGSAFSPQENSFWLLQKLQDFVPEVKSQYKFYEDAIVHKVKDGVMLVQEHPTAASGVGIISGLLLMRGPRRFMWRQTLGRLQREEMRYVKIDSGLKELGQSVDKLKKESKNILLRASFGDEELQRGRTKIRDAGNEIQRLIKSIYKIESQAAGSDFGFYADLMDGLRAIPGRNALKLRAEVASLTSDVKTQRRELDKKILKISELGIHV